MLIAGTAIPRNTPGPEDLPPPVGDTLVRLQPSGKGDMRSDGDRERPVGSGGFT
jgi:hypothetical protein